MQTKTFKIPNISGGLVNFPACPSALSAAYDDYLQNILFVFAFEPAAACLW
jgi:hypothetical protein